MIERAFRADLRHARYMCIACESAEVMRGWSAKGEKVRGTCVCVCV